MKVTKIIPKTIPILILRHEKPKILSKIGQNVPYLVVLGGYAYTLGGGYYIHLTMQAYLILGKCLKVALQALLFVCFLAFPESRRWRKAASRTAKTLAVSFAAK